MSKLDKFLSVHGNGSSDPEEIALTVSECSETVYLILIARELQEENKQLRAALEDIVLTGTKCIGKASRALEDQ